MNAPTPTNIIQARADIFIMIMVQYNRDICLQILDKYHMLVVADLLARDRLPFALVGILKLVMY